MSDEGEFYRFLSEFRTLSSTLSHQLSTITSLSSIDAQRESVKESEQTADELNSLISTIEPDLRHYPYAIKSKCQSQLQECQSQLEQQQNILIKYKTSLRQNRQIISETNARDALLADRTNVGAPSTAYLDQRGMLLDGRDLLQDGSESLDRTIGMIAETTAVGADTIDQLGQQREQFLKQSQMLDSTDTFLGRSGKTLRRMSRRIVTNKLLAAIIVLALIGLFGLIAWIKYLK